MHRAPPRSRNGRDVRHEPSQGPQPKPHRSLIALENHPAPSKHRLLRSARHFPQARIRARLTIHRLSEKPNPLRSPSRDPLHRPDRLPLRFILRKNYHTLPSGGIIETSEEILSRHRRRIHLRAIRQPRQINRLSQIPSHSPQRLHIELRLRPRFTDRPLLQALPLRSLSPLEQIPIRPRTIESRAELVLQFPRRPLISIPLVPLLEERQRIRMRKHKSLHKSLCHKKSVRVPTRSRNSRTNLRHIPARPLHYRNFFLAHSDLPVQSAVRCTPATAEKFVGVVWESPASATKSRAKLALWCNGNTVPFGGIIHGSSPCGAATLKMNACLRSADSPPTRKRNDQSP